ncbi:HAD family hydrolase [Mucilaginibacter sp.]|uniref:HAD family hydrolase n=1 Tax=Mucilaginibacter sp. TaxID=1882438 RepID=UPI000CA67B48|nr:HAD-IA family hydrolase [Mucilaginibacter sp.]PLW91340.1 MAG: HAD family phosphatase [Mucilaginibacter sp.]HEK18982.1 HAD family hydrolase [Bacteroidota bacterium]
MQQTEMEALEKLNNISEGYKAFLYDCDGTLADNMEAHRLTYVKVAAEHGLDFDGDIVYELAGWPTVKVVEEINRRYNTSLDPEEFNQKKYKLFLDDYINLTQPIVPVVEHLKLHAGKVKIGVVSGGSREAVEKTLNILNIADKVEVMVCAGETLHGKPFPDPFLKAAAELGVAPAECIVFEDAEPGVTAAKAAGMAWVRIDQL